MITLAIDPYPGIKSPKAPWKMHEDSIVATFDACDKCAWKMINEVQEKIGNKSEVAI